MGLLSTIGSASGRAFGFTRSAIAAATDAFFNRVTLLLNTGSTNGAQNNTFLDSSSNNFSITRNGNTTQGTFTPFSQTGWSNYFDGSGDYLLTPSNAAFNPSGSDITVDFFIYLNRYPNVNNIVFEIGTSTAGDVQCNIINTGTVRFTIGGSTGSTISGFTLNTWHYVTCVKSGTNFTVYLNGTAGTTVSLTANSKTQMYIGQQSGGNAIDGYLSNFRFVKGSANVPSGVPTTPLTNITNTSLLTCQDNRFIDNSTNAFALTPNGNVAVQAFSPFAPTAAYSTSVVGGSGYFDGTGDYLTLPTSNSTLWLGSGDYSAEAWCYLNTLNTINTIYSYGTSGNVFRLFIENNKISVWFGVTNLLGYTYTPQTNTWVHIVVTRVSGTLRIFVNGILQANVANSSNYNTGTLTVGAESAGGNPWTGYLSNKRIIVGGIPSAYSTSSTTNGTQIFTPPTAAFSGSESLTAGSLVLLLKNTNAGIFDAAAKNVLETAGNAQVSTTQAKFGTTSMAFDGTGDWLLMPDSPNLQLGTGDFTIEGFVYLNAAGVAYGIISKGAASTGWSVNVTSGNKLQFSYTATALTGATSLAASTWYYFAVVRSGSATGNLKVYLNGSVDATSGGAVMDNFNQTNVMYVGADRVAGSALNGYLDEVRVTKGVARTVTTTPTASFQVQ